MGWQVSKSMDEFLNLLLELSNLENFSLEVLSVDGKLLSRLADDIRLNGILNGGSVWKSCQQVNTCFFSALEIPYRQSGL